MMDNIKGKNYHVMRGDCLDRMEDIEPESVDLVVADLPYGTSYCRWDSVIPFEPLWEFYQKVIKPGAALLFFGTQPFVTSLIASNLKWFRYEWIWNKTHASNFANAKRVDPRGGGSFGAVGRRR